MNDTNQLREAFEARMTDDGKWPAAVEKGRGGAYLLAQTENAWTEWEACAEALQARAQVQDEPVLFIHPATFSMNQAHVGAWKPGHELPGYLPLYTTAQPAQAAQAEVTDAALTERVRIVDLIEGRACMHSGPHRLTLELNQLAEVIKSGLGWLEYERYKHNGITAQAKKETP